MSNTSNALTVIPAELKNQLPIFQVLGDKLPAPLKTVEGKKTIASIFYWALIVGGAFWFFKNLDSLLASVDLERIRKRVESTDWVDSAVVTRVWPDAIRVVVNEEVAAARWNDAGLLNARGELFIRNARYVPPELPLLEGPEGSESQVAQLYIDAQGRLLESGLRLTGVRLDDRGAWELELADGLQVRLGRQDVKERLERFIRLASPTVAKRVAEIKYVDMRYTNGFSVGWNARSALAVAPQEDATPDA